MNLIAKTFQGLEPVLADELRALGAENIVPVKRAVTFTGDKALMYRANLHLRTALRILVPTKRFRARNEEELYRRVQDLDWSEFFGVNQTFAIDSTVNSTVFTHSKYVALKTKDAIVDQFRARTGERPSIDTERPDVRINLHINDQEVTISFDSSGDSLHKRGYREPGHRAPLNEVLAAGMLQLSGWDGTKPLLDPMCGSGTILMEAAMLGSGMAPGLARHYFGFMGWRNFDREMWDEIRHKADGMVDKSGLHIVGSDVSPRALDLAAQSRDRFDFTDQIRLVRKDVTLFRPDSEGGIMITNPPYGERLAKEDINGFYKAIGDQLKKEFSGWQAWMLSANFSALKFVGLRPSRKIVLFNGPLECSFRRFDLYAGSKKGKYMNQNPEGESEASAS